MNITKGKIKKPLLCLVYGVDKVGKTTFGSQAPNPIFIGNEEGNNNMDVSRFESAKDFSDIMKQCNYLLNEKHDYKTVVFDSLDWIEKLLHDALCVKHKVSAIEDIGGYGKWVGMVVSEWVKFIELTTSLRNKGMNVIFIAHYQVKTFNDPMTSSPYDRYIVKLTERASALFREYVDVMLFATFEMSVQKDSANARKGKGKGDGIRVAYTERRPSHDAGNRFGLPYELPFDFQSLTLAIEASMITDVEVLRKEILDLTAEMTDRDLVKKIIESMVGADVNKLVVIKNRVKQIKGA